ncbi:MAG: hypothetical protein K0R62_2106 [Nonomuraea muscovyensis]|nr:hypothetical protein [Nonomuraea muscovyensis]
MSGLARVGGKKTLPGRTRPARAAGRSRDRNPPPTVRARPLSATGDSAAAPGPGRCRQGRRPAAPFGRLRPAHHLGAHHAPGGKAAAGRLQAGALDTSSIPPVATVRVTGTLRDRTRGPSCALAVFRLTYRAGDGSLPFTHKTVRTCSSRAAKNFAFTRAFLVELKVCAETGRTPSDTCLYAGTWKQLYASS